MHVPVMPSECLQHLAIRPDGVYLDATCGLGGHTGAIARQLTSGFVIACDRDAESLELARANTTDIVTLPGAARPSEPPRIRFHHVAFSLVGTTLEAESVPRLDGLLADLGVSRFQLTEGARGFSLMADGPLDMRMDRSQGPTAADLVNSGSERELADLIYKLGEERRSRKIARAIVRARPVTRTGQLAKLIESAVPRTGKLHPATQTFMALRIAVNRENEELDALLTSIPELMKAGGRVVFITFMSIEDRAVKRAFQSLERAGRAKILTRHVVRPTEEEIRENPASRSAKLRALEIL
ncbi:MAG TPA: 16S rRNA (cytosine(1402)-N(4))-methyltransferase RsmH [Bryobacteraceae bacterium]|nr:16S rRNA (cytosine(1402)-N(4))-methyltransferase RsmH [Bryobacteraceae bacterium]